MKFMKLGTRPDTFYTEQATRCVCVINHFLKTELKPLSLTVLTPCRTLISDTHSDLAVQVNDITYLLHKVQIYSHIIRMRKGMRKKNNKAFSLYSSPLILVLYAAVFTSSKMWPPTKALL